MVKKGVVTKSRLSLSIDTEILNKLKKMAEKDQRPVSSYINKLLIQVTNPKEIK